ncbi:MAG: PilW family protein [Deltaproteobacteria bacterium]|nr:PilW family protein [Deltaproteobacteria bacterium]
MKKYNKSFGFTIIELLIAVFISSIVLAGAFGVQMVFNSSTVSQQSVSDMQNNLDALRSYLRRTIQTAGAGLAQNIALQNCSGGYEYIPAIMVHNKNDYPPIADNSLGGTDNDPDWIEFVAPPSVDITSVNSWFKLNTGARVYSTEGFMVRDVVAINIGNSSCLMRINQILNSSPTSRYFLWNYKGGVYCMNPNNSLHPGCGINNNKTYYPTQTVSITSLGQFPFQALRIDESDPKTPILMHGVRELQNGKSTYTWSPLALEVEDMQIAFHLDTSPTPNDAGDIWINSRDLLVTEYSRIRTLRISVIIRSSRANSEIRTSRPALEDRPASAIDNYRRRRLIVVVKVPNKPILGGTI